MLFDPVAQRAVLRRRPRERRDTQLLAASPPGVRPSPGARYSHHDFGACQRPGSGSAEDRKTLRQFAVGRPSARRKGTWEPPPTTGSTIGDRVQQGSRPWPLGTDVATANSALVNRSRRSRRARGSNEPTSSAFVTTMHQGMLESRVSNVRWDNAHATQRHAIFTDAEEIMTLGCSRSSPSSLLPPKIKKSTAAACSQSGGSGKFWQRGPA